MTRTVAVIAGLIAALEIAAPVAGSAQMCVGDCSGTKIVRINDLILGVDIALGSQPLSVCPAFANSQGRVDVGQLVKAVENSLTGCPVSGPGDAEGYFPDALGDTWYYNVTGSTNGRPITDLDKTSVIGTTTVLGAVATIFEFQRYSAPPGSPSRADFFSKDLEGVTFLGNNDPSDAITPELIPYRELVFPVEPSPIAQFSKSGLDYGADLDGDGQNETIDVSLLASIEAFEPANVAAGSFPSAARHVLTLDRTIRLSASGATTPLSLVETTWLVPGIGPVKGSTVTMAANDAMFASTDFDARGYVLGGVRHGIGWPFSVAANLSPGNGYVPVPVGYPVVASDGTNFMVMARRATGGEDGKWLANWVGTLVGPDGDVLKAFDATAPTPVLDPSGSQRAAIASDGTDYLFVYEQDNDFARTGMAPSIQGVRISGVGLPLDGGFPLGAPGTASPAVSFDGTNYLLAYSYSKPQSGLTQIYGAFVSPTTGQITATGAFPIASEPGYQTRPVTAFDGTNYLVAWDQDLWASQRPGLYASRVGLDGTVLDPGGFAVSNQTGNPVSNGNPAIAFDGTNYLVAYNVGPIFTSQIKAMRISKSGALLDGSASAGGFPITNADGSAVSVALTFAASEYWVAWVSTPSLGEYDGIFGARISPDGIMKSPGLSGVRMGDATAAFFPALATNGSSGMLVWLNQYVPVNEVRGVSIHPFGP